MSVVQVAFVVIVQDFVGLRDGFEAYLCGFALGFGDFVRMRGECSAVVRLLDFRFRRG